MTWFIVYTNYASAFSVFFVFSRNEEEEDDALHKLLQWNNNVPRISWEMLFATRMFILLAESTFFLDYKSICYFNLTITMRTSEYG